ncbi:MAG: anti-sigma factor [Tepidiformaceae bacterium]
MTDNIEHPVDLLAELALGVLPEDEATEVQAHASQCGSCAHELSQMQRVALLLPFAVDESVPEPSVKTGLLARIAAEPRPIRAREVVRPRWQWAMAVAAASAFLLVGGGVLGAMLSGDSVSNRNEGRQASLVQAVAQGTFSTSRGEQGGATVTLVRAPGEHYAFAWVADLPALPADKAYQAWFIRDGKPEPSTVFRSGSGGVWIEAGDAIERFGSMALTIEDSGGSKSPTTAPFVAVELQKSVRASLN